MRLLCLVNGGCRWTVVKEKWTEEKWTRFSECSICGDTRCTVTAPEVEDTRYSKPLPTMQFSTVGGKP